MNKTTHIRLEVEIVKLIGVLVTAYPYAQVSRETIKTYASMVRDIPLDVLTVAVEQSIADCEFFPTIKVLRERAFSLTSNLSTHPTGGEAWGVVRQEILRTGFYRSPHFDDRIIEKTVEHLGWGELCSSDNHVADRAHFIKIYEALVARELEDAKLLPSARDLRHASTLALACDGPDDYLLGRDTVVH